MHYQHRPLLDRDLIALNDKTQQLASMVVTALDRSMEALYERNVELARQVIADDQRVNELRYEIEEDCLRTIATQQPAATDLRTIIAATHIAGELERIGDHATSIARVVERVWDQEPFESLVKLPKMAKHAILMVEASVEAFLQHDASMAEEIERRENKMDQHYETLFDEVILEMRDDAYIERGTFLLWVGRHLERVGDRATNIAERVIFLTTGKFIEIS
jgi:phosphate transport system protein